jgi:CRP-like cAMP-binding protein
VPDALGKIAWVGTLDPDERRLVERESSRLEFDRGETVFSPTPAPQSVYVLESGLVRIYRLDESGAETTFGYVAPGEVFGELTAFGAHPRESFAGVCLPSVVRRFGRAAFERLVRARPDRMMAVTQQIAERLKRIESRLEHLVFDDVRSRLASILLELGHDFGEARGTDVVIRLPLTQSELATLIGATRQTVNATLAEFRGEGLVEREDGRIVLRSADGLRTALRGAAAPASGGGPGRS